jgi:hypothetical protein
MRELAPPGGIVIAEGTKRLIGDPFELRDLGAVQVTGFAAADAGLAGSAAERGRKPVRGSARQRIDPIHQTRGGAGSTIAPLAARYCGRRLTFIRRKGC